MFRQSTALALLVVATLSPSTGLAADAPPAATPPKAELLSGAGLYSLGLSVGFAPVAMIQIEGTFKENSRPADANLAITGMAYLAVAPASWWMGNIARRYCAISKGTFDQENALQAADAYAIAEYRYKWWREKGETISTDEALAKLRHQSLKEIGYKPAIEALDGEKRKARIIELEKSLKVMIDAALRKKGNVPDVGKIDYVRYKLKPMQEQLGTNYRQAVKDKWEVNYLITKRNISFFTNRLGVLDAEENAVRTVNPRSPALVQLRAAIAQEKKALKPWSRHLVETEHDILKEYTEIWGNEKKSETWRIGVHQSCVSLQHGPYVGLALPYTTMYAATAYREEVPLEVKPFISFGYQYSPNPYISFVAGVTFANVIHPQRTETVLDVNGEVVVDGDGEAVTQSFSSFQDTALMLNFGVGGNLDIFKGIFKP